MPQYVEVNGQNIEFPDGMAAPEIEAAIKKNYLSIPAAKPAAPTLDNFSLKGEGWDKVQNYSGKDAVAGATRGAASIGSTLLAPVDAGLRAVGLGNVPYLGASNRRGDLDPALANMGANPDSTQFKTNKLITEVAGTSGVGAGLGGLLSKVPGAVKALPTLLPAIQSGGMTAGGATGGQGLIARGVGGSINGGVTAGLVDPADAKGGAMLGAAIPTVIKGMGSAGNLMPTPSKAMTPNPTTLATAREGIDAGYILPPATLKPTFGNRVLEAWSGKDATKQLVSMRNSDVTEKLVRKALDIPADIPLTQGTMENLRKTAGKAYAEVSSLSPQAAADLEALKLARNNAQAQFKFYNQSGNPEVLAQAKKFSAEAEALESALEGHAAAADKQSLIPALREARKQIAKTYTVGRALNDAAGTINASVLARMSEKGKPLSDGLETAGRFASAFPTAVRSPQQIGSPGVSKLSAGASAILGGGGAALLGPFGAAAAAAPFIVPPVARARLLSKSMQKGLVAPKGGGGMGGLLSDAEAEMLPLIYRSNGLLANY